MKAADIPDETFLAAIDEALNRRDPMWRSASVMRHEVQEVLAESYPGIPYKVVLAKARKLILRKKMSGCFCGCRGDWGRT